MARPRQISDEQILTVARECVLKHGPTVSTTVIAKQLGVSQAALFKRFGTRTALMLRALLPEDPAGWIHEFRDGPDERPIPEQLVELATAANDAFQRIIPCMIALKGMGGDLKAIIAERFETPPPVAFRRHFVEWIERAQAQGRMRAGDSGAIAVAVLGALHSRAVFRHIFGDQYGVESDDVFVAGLIDTIWNGVAPEVAR